MSLRIALTGGIACGKSLVAKFLNELGVETIDADDVVHELIPDPEERKRIAAEVFADAGKRKELEAKIHPLVRERVGAWLDTVPDARPSVIFDRSRRGADPSIRLSAPRREGASGTVLRLAVIPLLFETRWDADYDIICCVRSARATQVARMMETRGYTREEAEARLAAQMSVEEKAKKSHYVIENNGSAEELKFKVAEFVRWLENLDGRR